MSGRLTFLKAPDGANALTELTSLLERYSATDHYEKCMDVLEYLKSEARDVPAHLAAVNAWRTFKGANGGTFPVILTDTDPLAVYVAIRRKPPERDELRAVYFVDRAGRHLSELVDPIWDEVSMRLKQSGL